MAGGVLSYQVFIRGVRTPGSEEAVAAGIGQRYGLPADALVPRLKSGQFRVKAGIDEATARAYVAELSKLGAIAVIIDGSGAELPGAAPRNTGSSLSVAAPNTAPQRDTSSSLSAARPVEKAPSTGEFQTGLLAATGGDPAQDLGALGAGDNLLSLTTVDGDAEPKAEARAAAVTDEEAFLPPEAQEEIALDLAIPTKAAPLETADSGVGGEVGVPGFVALDEVAEGFEDEFSPAISGKAALARYLWDRPRALLLSAVLVGIVIGFVPAMIYSQFSESSAYGDSEKALKLAYADARENGSWDDLPEAIEKEKSALASSRQSSNIISILLWLVVAGGVGFVWWRVLPWHLWAADPEPTAPEPT